MKSKYLIITFLFALLISGCYTQLGTVKQERENYDEEYTYEYQNFNTDTIYERDGRTIINNYYFDGYWYPRYRWMFSYYPSWYYWPSSFFSVTFYDPWYWDRYWYYDPYPWCYYPWVSYPIYYPPYYWYRPIYVVTRDGEVTRTRRDFGNQRDRLSGRSDNEMSLDRFGGGRSDFNIPPAVGVTGTGRSSNQGSEQIRGKSRSGEDSRSITPRSSSRSSSNKGESKRPPSRRERYEQPARESNSGRSGTIQSNDDRKREGTRIYTPAPPSSTPSAPASPPPSRGGDSRGSSGGSNDNNSRSGNTRGSR